MKLNNQLNFLIADDHTIVRQGVSIVLKGLFSKSNVFQATNFKEVLKYVKLTVFDLIILDVSFPEGDSLELVKNIKSLQPQARILIFSAHDENIYALRYLNNGANGYLKKDSNEEDFVDAVKSVLTNGKYTSREVNEKILDNYILKKPNNPFETLSDRELQVTNLLVEGYSNGEISEKLNLKRTTVSTYKLRIFEKIGVDSLAALIQSFLLYDKAN